MESKPKTIAIGVIAATLAAAALTIKPSADAASEPKQGETAVAVFAGGCFWCMEPPFDKLDGVLKTTSGYVGGTVVDPSYEQVSSGRTGHYEALRIEYDSGRVSYPELLAVFWRNVDPLDGGGQFCDRGGQYKSAIFPLDERQREAAAASLAALEASEKLDGAVQTEILAAAPFYAAEDYHQDYYVKNPARYKFYRWSCGRDRRLAKLWGKSSDH